MNKLSCLITTFALVFSTQSFAMDDSTADSYLASEKETCAKNTAMEWSSTLNRCIGKAAARETRNTAKECDTITDLAAKEKCHLSLAEKTTGVSSDTATIAKGNNKSLMMNGVAAAYSVVSIISSMGKGQVKSNCLSKKILGVTSVAGIASDIYLKMSAKKKVKELEGKYKLDKASTAYEAQLKALEYLKEEQETVVAIAGLEKKRNMALMAGYGLAAGYAVYEMTFGQNPECYKSAGGDGT